MCKGGLWAHIILRAPAAARRYILVPDTGKKTPAGTTPAGTTPAVATHRRRAGFGLAVVQALPALAGAVPERPDGRSLRRGLRRHPRRLPRLSLYRVARRPRLSRFCRGAALCAHAARRVSRLCLSEHSGRPLPERPEPVSARLCPPRRARSSFRHAPTARSVRTACACGRGSCPCRWRCRGLPSRSRGWPCDAGGTSRRWRCSGWPSSPDARCARTVWPGAGVRSCGPGRRPRGRRNAALRALSRAMCRPTSRRISPEVARALQRGYG